MDEQDWLAARFEENRGHLRGVAYRMLGSLAEADDAVQEAWLRLDRSGRGGIENFRGWLTTVVARVCLDMLRSRNSRREEPQDEQKPGQMADREAGIDPEREALLAESVGLALLVVLDRLEPAERLAFVLHDMFALPFEEIAEIVGRSPTAARQLASRARRRVHGAAPAPDAEVAGQKEVVDAFLAAMRRGDFEGLLAVLDPDVVVRGGGAGAAGVAREIHGARDWARGALTFSQRARHMQTALLDGQVGIVLAPGGRLVSAVRFTVRDGKIVEAEVIANRERLAGLDITILSN